MYLKIQNSSTTYPSLVPRTSCGLLFYQLRNFQEVVDQLPHDVVVSKLIMGWPHNLIT